MKKSQSGFTLVELVVVILILGILSATALPKFMNINDQAHSAAVAGASGGLAAGAALVRAQWIANQEAPGEDTVANFGAGDVAVTTSNGNTTQTGWPTGTTGADNIVDAAQCVTLWTGILQNPPTIAASGTTTDYTAAAVGNTGCTFSYNNDNANVRTITYSTAIATPGAITLVNP